MRSAVLTLAVVIAGVAGAQEPAPDTTAPWRYFPLDVGNRWEYRYYDQACYVCPQVPYGYWRWIAQGDTSIAGVAYQILRREQFDLDLNVTSVGDQYVRFDTSSARIVEWAAAPPGEQPFELAPCRLDQPFTAYGPCDFGAWYYEGGEYDHLLADSTLATVKLFQWTTIGRWLTLAAGLGMYELWDDQVKSYVWYELVYGRTRARTYGAPHLPPPVSIEDSAPEASSPLFVAPNPTNGPLVIRFRVPGYDWASLQVFDALGRPVHTAEVAAAGGRVWVQLDGARWAPGVYVVRVTAGSVNVSASVVRR
jgi:hypothetical protein